MMSNTQDPQIDWKSLRFGYSDTDCNVRCRYSNGKWGEIEVTSDPNIQIHMAASCLQYGQEVFEGLKAFRGRDGKVRIFRLEENARRIAESAKGIKMEPIPEELFCKMVKMAVKLNERFVPPFESGASMYIRPLEIGMSPRVGVAPASEYLFVVMVMPVGAYFSKGITPTKVCITREYDRVAPKGTGRWKVGGNYAASLVAGEMAHSKGYSSVLYLDPKEKKYIDECGPANFFAIKGNKYITPASESILPSITSKSLMQIARDLGMEVEARHITVEELRDIDEAAAVGTAAVTSPISEIDDLDTGDKYVVSKDGNVGPVVLKLYNTLRGIQYGDLPDNYNWITFVE